MLLGFRVIALGICGMSLRASGDCHRDPFPHYDPFLAKIHGVLGDVWNDLPHIVIGDEERVVAQIMGVPAPCFDDLKKNG